MPSQPAGPEVRPDKFDFARAETRQLLRVAPRRPDGFGIDFPAMVEIAAAFGVALVLLLVAAGGDYPHADLLLYAGAGVLAVGLTVGVAAGGVYHVALFRALSPHGTLRPGWWWRPTSLHERLSPALRRRVMPWFYAGAAGFFVALAGCALVLVAIVTM
jgi:hypothetical protein